MKWLHRLLKPHCDECQLEQREKKICQSCETLKSELATVRFQNDQLMKSILDIVHPPIPEVTAKQEPDFKPLTSSWRVKKQMLEENDRRAAEVLKAKRNEIYESSKSTQELEKELLGESNAI